jgi:hypothetical protein
MAGHPRTVYVMNRHASQSGTELQISIPISGYAKCMHEITLGFAQHEIWANLSRNL